MKKISLILLIPFGSLIGISILFNVYNDYLKMAASQYNYDYLYICLFRLLEALILFISILVYMKDIQKEDNNIPACYLGYMYMLFAYISRCALSRRHTFRFNDRRDNRRLGILCLQVFLCKSADEKIYDEFLHYFSSEKFSRIEYFYIRNHILHTVLQSCY